MVLFYDIEMKQYIKPNTQSFSVISNALIAASKELGVETPQGGFYYCSKAGCRTENPLTWNENKEEGRDLDKNYIPKRDYLISSFFKKEWQYIGCYEYKSNGSGVDCEVFHGTTICEGTQWDLFINANSEYYVRSCPDGVH